MKNWYSSIVYGVPTATTVMGLTVDHWSIVAATTGICCSIITALVNIWYRYKKEKREARNDEFKI